VDRFQLRQGTAPALVCSSDTLRGNDLPTYGSTWSVNPVTCDSKPRSLNCTDTGTGLYFWVSGIPTSCIDGRHRATVGHRQ
jgi:hypothetical protein